MVRLYDRRLRLFGKNNVRETYPTVLKTIFLRKITCQGSSPPLEPLGTGTGWSDMAVDRKWHV